MIPYDLRVAAIALGLTGRGLAAALGVNERTYRRWLEGAPIPRVVELACEALLSRQVPAKPIT